MHEVIAAIKIEPSIISKSELGTFEIEKFSFFVISLKLLLKLFEASVNKTLSCGLFGPEIVGTIVDMSNVKVSVNSISSLAHKPWVFAYSSTIFTMSLSLPENFKYLIVSSSIGKKPQVAPYSGAIFAIVARSANVKFFNPFP